ncbi:MAG: cytochrome c biogenesis protein ResB [Candidatus Hydrogenedentes bacterium]|nr:cytochrome c biogenesis protein ResB [Candidatus Hydrogenedentota bacterium]
MLKKYLKFLGSYKLSVAILLFLSLVVFLGTLAQTEKGIYDVQRIYFTSIFFVHWLLGIIPLPLPGGGLLLLLLTINLFIGGVLLAPKNIKRPGMLIAHGGVIFLLLGGFWGHLWGKEGLISLTEGENKNWIESTTHWEIYIWKLTNDNLKPEKEWTIKETNFSYLKGGLSKTITAPDLPFKIVLMRFIKNAEPHLAIPGSDGNVQGVYLSPTPLETDEERNLPGIYVEIASNKGNQVGVLWGGEKCPWIFTVDETNYAIGLRKTREKLPFSITLLKFTKEFYPRTNKPKFFSSEVVCNSGNLEQRAIIKMNEPLRFFGYTIYQASWGTTITNEGEKDYTVLAITKNPAERIPLFSCLIISTGLLIHFTQKIIRYVKVSV